MVANILLKEQELVGLLHGAAFSHNQKRSQLWLTFRRGTQRNVGKFAGWEGGKRSDAPAQVRL